MLARASGVCIISLMMVLQIGECNGSTQLLSSDRSPLPSNISHVSYGTPISTMYGYDESFPKKCILRVVQKTAK